MQSYLLIFFTGFLVAFIYNNKKGRKKEKDKFSYLMTYSKGQQIPPKTSHIWYNQEQYHPPFGFIDTASGSSNTKKGECTERYLGHINQASKTLSFILLGLLWLFEKISYISPGNINYSWQH